MLKTLHIPNGMWRNRCSVWCEVKAVLSRSAFSVSIYHYVLFASKVEKIATSTRDLIHSPMSYIGEKSRFLTALSFSIIDAKAQCFMVFWGKANWYSTFLLCGFHAFLSQHFFNFNIFKLSCFWSSARWSGMYSLCVFVEEFDTVFCHASATDVTGLHRPEFGQHLYKLAAVCGIFSGDVNFVLLVLQ